MEKDVTRRTGVGLTWMAKKKKKKSEHIEIDEYNSSLKWVVHATSEQTVCKCAMAIIAQPCNIRVFTGSSTCFLMTQPSSFIYSDCRIKTDLLFHDKVTSPWNFPICIFFGTSRCSFVSISGPSCVYWRSLAAQRVTFFQLHTFVKASTTGPQRLLCAKDMPSSDGSVKCFPLLTKRQSLKRLRQPHRLSCSATIRTNVVSIVPKWRRCHKYRYISVRLPVSS